MELSETLRLRSIFLDLHWVSRERNQWADDLTNGELGRFPAAKRQELDAHAMQWHVLGRLLDVAQTFHDEIVSEKKAAKQRRRGGHVSTSTVRKAKRARTKWRASSIGVAWGDYACLDAGCNLCPWHRCLNCGCSISHTSSPNLGSPIRLLPK